MGAERREGCYSKGRRQRTIREEGMAGSRPPLTKGRAAETARITPIHFFAITDFPQSEPRSSGNTVKGENTWAAQLQLFANKIGTINIKLSNVCAQPSAQGHLGPCQARTHGKDIKTIVRILSREECSESCKANSVFPTKRGSRGPWPHPPACSWS